jgi:Fe-S cluster assembly protein SufD
MEIKELTGIEQELYAQFRAKHQEDLSREHPSLRRIRQEAMELLTKKGLPGIKDEEYKYAQFGKILSSRKFRRAIPVADPENALERSTPQMWMAEDADFLLLINGLFIPHLSRIPEVNPGLSIETMESAWTKYPIQVERHFGRIVDYTSDAYAAWNAALWSGGLFIHLADGAQLARPLIIYNLADSSTGDQMIAPRNLILAGKHTQGVIIEISEQTGEGAVFINSVTEISADEGARINFFKYQNRNKNAYEIDLTRISQSTGGLFNAYTFSFGGAMLRNNMQIAMEQENCESHLYGLYLLKGKTLVDNHTVVDHKKPHCFSNELYKGVMDEYSTGVFNGKIFVRPDAQKTNAFQSNKNLVLTDTASVNTKPQLEIWADDVKCSHGCTTGQLDREQLFYLRSRGISEQRAVAMLLQAFAYDVLEKVEVPFFRRHLEQVILQRLHD